MIVCMKCSLFLVYLVVLIKENTQVINFSVKYQQHEIQTVEVFYSSDGKFCMKWKALEVVRGAVKQTMPCDRRTWRRPRGGKTV